MGSLFSRAFDRAPPQSGDLVAAEEKKEKREEVRRTKLPCPTAFYDLHREADLILKPIDHFEGMRITLKKRLNERFSVLHNVTMEPAEYPGRHNIYKISTGSYVFGVMFADPKVVFFGETDLLGTALDANVKYNLTNNLTCKIHSVLTKVPNCSYSTIQFDYKGESYQSQFHIEKHVYGAAYIKSVTQNLSLGSRLNWRSDLMTVSMFGLGAQYKANKMIANGVITNGSISLSYIQNLSEKVSLASEFIYKRSTGDVTSSFGYHYKFRNSLLWGKVNSNAVASSYLEREIGSCTKLVVSAEIDHVKKNHKFGYGLKFDSTRPVLR